jgi:hypothetical protein
MSFRIARVLRERQVGFAAWQRKGVEPVPDQVHDRDDKRCRHQRERPGNGLLVVRAGLDFFRTKRKILLVLSVPLVAV